MGIKCCKDCVPPKRDPYCHGTCPDYIREKAESDARRDEDFKKRSIKSGLILQTERAVRNATKRKRKKGAKHEQ